MATLDEIKGARTFKEWKTEGFFVIRGEKSRHRRLKDGAPLFLLTQVACNTFPQLSDEDMHEQGDLWGGEHNLPGVFD